MDLEDYRREIDRVNREIADAVSRRMNIVDEIAAYKQEHNMQVVDQSREEEVKQQFEKLFGNEDLPQEKGRELAELLIEIATERQK
ncbi:MAG: chorismate mutase [Candidatus Nanohaloarchaea archaeon]